jgi:hypothetical protein
MLKNKCTKSHDGKHDWTYEIRTDTLGIKRKYRRCDYCHLLQKHVESSSTQNRWRDF